SEAQMYFGYTNLGKRLQFNGAFSQWPYYFLSNDELSPSVSGVQTEKQEITIYVARSFLGTTSYPLNRFTRIELGGGLNNIGRQRIFLWRKIINSTTAT